MKSTNAITGVGPEVSSADRPPRAAPPRRRRIVLLEPDADGRELYVEYLRFLAFDVVAPLTTDEAFAQAAAADAIVTGVGVQGSMDAFELIGRLREGDTQRLAILVVTAYVFDTYRAAALAAGADAFLPKPCLPETLVGELLRVITARRHARVPLKATHSSPGHPTKRTA